MTSELLGCKPEGLRLGRIGLHEGFEVPLATASDALFSAHCTARVTCSLLPHPSEQGLIRRILEAVAGQRLSRLGVAAGAAFRVTRHAASPPLSRTASRWRCSAVSGGASSSVRSM